MKKIFNISGVLLAAALLFVSCNNGNDNTSQPSSEPEEAPEIENEADKKTETSVPAAVLNKTWYKPYLEFFEDGTAFLNDETYTYTYSAPDLTLHYKGEAADGSDDMDFSGTVADNTITMDGTFTKITNTSDTTSLTGIWACKNDYQKFTTAKYYYPTYVQKDSTWYIADIEYNYTYDKATHLLNLTNGKYLSFKNLTTGEDCLAAAGTPENKSYNITFEVTGKKAKETITSTYASICYYCVTE